MPCASLISFSDGDVLTDGTTETCVDTMPPEGAFNNISLRAMKTCIQDNVINLGVTVTSSTDCVNVGNSLFVPKYSDCNNVLTPCKMTTTNLLNDHNVCALKCMCTEVVDFCELLIHPGVLRQSLEICEIKMIL